MATGPTYFDSKTGNIAKTDVASILDGPVALGTINLDAETTIVHDTVEALETLGLITYTQS